ncbi:phosphopantothenoylcysteine decarboxylase phosphopantothenate cysteine ligase putative [Entamoeba histolytica]|uniref:Coenzyme A biosynthesis bifunctional protein coaBC, putative n=2 Tax=Entamoeba histolytica TaxID=5759 RepID=B1N2N3_ENTH1|nr:coenzyme A biosynthesis bifunctional protein coaBC, putative [Entamoeba histolytica HM-1:IMSS]EDS89774.1 coenzyme A biosynthesis bifunctional protein coaBC, putative [Entamoeba histolytica HM-1:IMSS]GAT92466.1 phosphopantothenoylcysteine decarboxylase phosphopantothenate cysteine ligase putative [Entamoeba histolytica]|eukprot:XP_001913449.1 coenzyme A biosynthesis bifunctional protein coaBC, putative [Entamoeba histolytica HM-1:IMSS]
MKTNNKIILGITASIAAYKGIYIANELTKRGYDVHVTLTQNTLHLIQPYTIEVLTHNKCIIDSFDRPNEYDVHHISLAHSASLFLIAPATADIIAKLASGIADDFLTTTFLAATCPKLIAPAMNTTMLHNPITQRNIQILKSFGVTFINSSYGKLACGDVGDGKLASVDSILTFVDQQLHPIQPLLNKKIVITAGPTIEPIDPVRFITNHSTGKMGYAIAQVAQQFGATVTLITGPTTIQKPSGVSIVNVQTAIEMYDAVMKEKDVDIYIMSAAVADYRPMNISNQKIKKDENELTITLVKNPDILKEIGDKRNDHQIIVGFAMETQDLIQNAQEKLKKKHCDMIVANQLNVKGAGFGGETNKVAFITKDGIEETEVLLKSEIARLIIEKVIDRINQ